MFTQYDPKNSSVLVDGVHITGRAEDFWSFEKQAALGEDEVGAMGDVCRSVKNHPLYNVTITTQKTSPQVPFLRSLASRQIPFPIWNIDKALGVREGGSQCLMTEVPADERGATAGELEFKFTAYDGVIENI